MAANHLIFSESLHYFKLKCDEFDFDHLINVSKEVCMVNTVLLMCIFVYTWSTRLLIRIFLKHFSFYLQCL